MVYNFFDSKVASPDKKSMGSGTAKPSSLERVAKSSPLILAELHKPVIKKFNKKKVYSQFKDNIWGVDLANMQSLSNLAKLTNVVKSETVKKTDFSFDDYVKETKFSADTNALDDKIDKVDKKIPDASNLASKSSVTVLIRDLSDRIDKIKIKDYAKKTSLSGYMLTSDFNTKSSELENKIKDADIIAKSAFTKANAIKSDLNDYAKKADVANDITTIKNDYFSNESLTSRLNDLKSQHIATEVKSIDEKTKKNASYILSFESRLKQKEDILDDVQRENALRSGRDYHDEIYLLYEYRAFSFKYTSSKINLWKSTGLNNYSRNSDMDAASVATTSLPYPRCLF